MTASPPSFVAALVLAALGGARGASADQPHYHTGKLSGAGLNVKRNAQGTGAVNTVGAMNGYRVPVNE